MGLTDVKEVKNAIDSAKQLIKDNQKTLALLYLEDALIIIKENLKKGN